LLRINGAGDGSILAAMKSRVAILFALLAVFTAGAAAGWAYGRQEGLKRSQRPPGKPADMPGRVISWMEKDLQLTAEQRQKMEPIVRETWTKIEETQKVCSRQIHEMVRAQHLQFKEFLTDPQWIKLQEMEARRGRRRGGGTNSPNASGGLPSGHPPGPPTEGDRR